MDGNRRFANKSCIDKKQGHAKGFDKLSETLQWCLDIGVKEVTVYAFSIENFKRSEDEVDALMSLAREKFEKLLEERDKLHEKGIRIQIIGNLRLLPKDIAKSMAEAMILTKDNKSSVLNVAFAYTSRDEITNAIKTISGGVKSKDIQLDDIDENLISKCLYTNQSTDPDLLVRTSGEVRFSDFLLWQVKKHVFAVYIIYTNIFFSLIVRILRSVFHKCSMARIQDLAFTRSNFVLPTMLYENVESSGHSWQVK